MSDAPDMAKRPRPRTARVKDWIPDQPGAWVMALAPALAGLVVGGPTADSVWLFVLWGLCYCFQFTAARWLKSRFARRYMPPMLGYGIALAVPGVPFVAMNLDVLRWAPVYMVLAALSFLAAWLRRERSLWGNAVALVASSLMATVVASYGSHNPLHAMMPATAVMMSLAFARFQFGSVLFVKTMIRERGSRAYLAASILWHAVLFAAVTWRVGAVVSGPVPSGWIPMRLMWMELAAIWLLARAIALPWIGARRRLRPMVVGLVEMVSSLLVFAAILVAVMM